MAQGLRTILIEAHEGKTLVVLAAPHLRRLLSSLGRVRPAADQVRRGLGVLARELKSMSSCFTFPALGPPAEADAAHALQSPVQAEAMALTVPLFVHASSARHRDWDPEASLPSPEGGRVTAAAAAAPTHLVAGPYAS